MPVSIFEGNKAERVAKALERLAGNSRLDQTFEAMLDGTNTSKIFGQWWPISGEGTDSRYTRLERWFSMLARCWAGKTYTVRWNDWHVSNDPKGTPLADLADKAPAGCYTEVDANTPEWCDEDPMTWYVRANAISLADGTMHILAVEGVDPGFDVSGNIAPVYTFSLALWMAHYTDGTYEYKTWATTQQGGMRPMACDVAPDNSKRVMTWHATFGGSLTADGKLTSGVGNQPAFRVSATAGLTAARKWDAYEGTYSDTDRDHLLNMWQLRHFSLENSGELEGCLSYTWQYTVAMAEDGVTSALVTTAQAASILIGSSVELGSHPDGTDSDRNTAANRDLIAYAKVERIETVTIDDVEFARVHLGIVEPVNIPATALLSSMPWEPGSTERLPGRKDGSLYNCTNGKNPARIAGIEVLDGAYAVGLDPLWVNDYDESRTPQSIYTVYQCRDSEKQSSATTNYEEVGTFQSATAGWHYIKRFAIRKDGMLLPEALGGSSTTGMKSAFYFYTSSGVRCLWCFGYLHLGGYGGVAYATGYDGPGSAYWRERPRLSGSGKKRGEWAA